MAAASLPYGFTRVIDHHEIAGASEVADKIGANFFFGLLIIHNDQLGRQPVGAQHFV